VGRLCASDGTCIKRNAAKQTALYGVSFCEKKIGIWKSLPKFRYNDPDLTSPILKFHVKRSRGVFVTSSERGLGLNAWGNIKFTTYTQ
jgi:hypothetical protein